MQAANVPPGHGSLGEGTGGEGTGGEGTGGEGTGGEGTGGGGGVGPPTLIHGIPHQSMVSSSLKLVV